MKTPKFNIAGGERYRVAAIIVSLAICAVLTYYLQAKAYADVPYTHIFYIPIILASLWWGVAAPGRALFCNFPINQCL